LRHHASLVFVHLPIAARDVVAHHVTGDILESGVFADVLAVFAYDDGKLALVIALELSKRRDRNGAAGVCDCGSWLGEKCWVRWEIEAGFEDCSSVSDRVSFLHLDAGDGLLCDL
jgi:hypothetical protein